MSQKLFIIHGWTYNLDKWQAIVPLLKKQGLDPIFLKVPGLTAPSSEVWDIDGYINWLDGELAGEAKPIVVGHSNGGRIALAYLQKHPGRFKQLILIDAAAVAHDEPLHKAKLKVLRTASKVGKPLKKIPVVNKAFYKVIGAQDYNKAPENMRKTMQNMLNADSDLDLASIQLPVTLIWGEEDATTPLKEGKQIQQLIKGSNLHVISGARHTPQHTHAQQVADLITDAVRAQ